MKLRGFVAIILVFAAPTTQASDTLLSSAALTQLPQLASGQNLRLDVQETYGQYPEYGVEPYVAVGGDGGVHVAWMGTGDGNMWYSETSGQTFSHPIQVSPNRYGPSALAYVDPSIGLSHNESVYVAFTGVNREGRAIELILAKQTASSGTLTFTNRIEESCSGSCDKFWLDRPWITIGKSGAIYLVWWSATPAVGIYWSKSVDAGITFSSPALVNALAENRLWGFPAGIAVDDNETLHVAMLAGSQENTPNMILYARPTESNFDPTSPRIISEINVPYNVDYRKAQEFWPGPAIAVDNSDVYIVYASDMGHSLYLRHNGNRGLGAWDAPVLIRSSSGFVEMPWMTAANGTELIVWRENGSGYWNTYISEYANNTVSSAVRVSDQNGYSANVNDWHGDFMGVGFVSSSEAVVTWSDGRGLGTCPPLNGCGHIYLASVGIGSNPSLYTMATQTSTSTPVSLTESLNYTFPTHYNTTGIGLTAPQWVNYYYVSVVAMGLVVMVILFRKRIKT